MKKLLIVSIALLVTGCTNSQSILNVNKKESKQASKETSEVKKPLIINIDREFEEAQNRSKKSIESDIIDKTLFIKGQKEIIFHGELLKQKAPITIEIGRIIDDEDDNDEVSFHDTFHSERYIIRTHELRDGDKVIMKDKNGVIFSSQTVDKENLK